MHESDEVLLKEGISVDLKILLPKWETEIKNLFEKSNLKIPETVFMQTGGRKGIHTEHLAFLLAEMQALPRMYPDAKW